MIIDWKSPNLWIALILILFVLSLFAVIIAKQFGGNEALFLIIGHVAAWVQMVVVFFFRKSPSKTPK